MRVDVEPPERNGLPWLYCGRCGASMDWEQHGSGYSRTDGRRVDLIWWTCPAYLPNEGGRTHDRSNTPIGRPPDGRGKSP